MCDGYGTCDSDRITALVNQLSDYQFTLTSRSEVRPEQVVATVDHQRRQVNAVWGICPPWTNSLISVAEGEKVNITKTFAGAFESYRCLIPVDCWYQWAGELHDQKYRFQLGDGEPLLMAGVLFPSRKETAVVPLTVRANREVAEIHDRMPVFINAEQAHTWLTAPAKDASPLIGPLPDGGVRFDRC